MCVSHITDPIDGTVSIHETIPPPGTVGMVHGSYNILLLQQYTIVVSRILYKGAHYSGNKPLLHTTNTIGTIGTIVTIVTIVTINNNTVGRWLCLLC